jgi:shikimate dehydrogenase
MSGVTAQTGLLGIIGHPVAHSFSPLFMNHALSLLHLDYRYLAFDVDPERVGVAAGALRALNIRGVSVTVPHKQTVMHYLDRVDRDARRIGAVNCIVNSAGTLEGRNTDHAGFVKPLRDLGYRAGEGRTLVIGCGGAARAVMFALTREGAGEILTVNRTRQRAAELESWCSGELGFEGMVHLGPAEALSQKTLKSCSLVVNTTPVGMHPHTEGCPLPPAIRFDPGQLVYDLIYNPLETRLLAMARESGARTINGLTMLVTQGLYALAAWFPQKEKQVFELQHDLIKHIRSTTLQDPQS